MKNKNSIVWILLLCASALSISPRHRRATEGIDTSIERLKKVARLVNGIYLTGELTKGIDKNKTDTILKELLILGTLSPDEVENFNYKELETGIEAMKSLRENLNSSVEVKKVEENWKIMMEMNRDLKGISDYTKWPDQADFKAAMEELKAKSIGTPHVTKMIGEIQSLASIYGKIKDTDDAAIKMTGTGASGLIPLIDQLDSDEVKGSVMEFSAIPVKIGKSAVNTAKLVAANDDGCEENVKNIFQVGKLIEKIRDGFPILSELIRRKGKFSRNLEHTPGFPEGIIDLQEIQLDLKNEWISRNFPDFQESLRTLETLEVPLEEFEGNITRCVGKLPAIRKIRGETEILAKFSGKFEEGMTAVDKLKSCAPPATNGINFPNIRVIMKSVKEIEEEFRALKKSIDNAKVRFVDVKEKLKDLAEVCEKATLPNRDLKAIVTEIKAYDELIQELISIISTIKVNDNRVKTQAQSASDASGKVLSELRALQSYNAFFGCLQIDHLELIADSFGVIENYRFQDDIIPFDGVLKVTRAVANASMDLGLARQAIHRMAGSSLEHKELQLKKKTSDTIGKAVQAVIQMHEVFKKATEIETVILKLEAIEIPDSFDQKEVLNELIGLNASFVAMKSSLATWHSAVKDKEVRALSDAKSIFEPSKDVTGVKRDLNSMIAALERLIEQVPPKLQDLKALHFSLRELESFNLDFGSYAEPLASVGGALDGLEQFFADIRDPPTTRMATSTEPETSSEKEEIPLRSAGGSDGKKVKVKEWEIVPTFWTIELYALLVIPIGFAGFLVFVVMDTVQNNRKLLNSYKERQKKQKVAAPMSPVTPETSQTQPSSTPKLAPSPASPKIAQKMSSEEPESKDLFVAK